MTLYEDLRIHLLTLKYFGLLCFTYDYKRNVLYMKSKDILYAKIVFCILQIILLIMFVYCILYPTKFYLPIYNRTGNIYISCEFCIICSMQSFISGYFFTKRHEHLRTVQQLFNLNCNKKLPQRCERLLKRLYGIYLLLLIICGQNYIKGFLYSFLPITVFISYSLLFTFNFMICGMIMLWYICIERIIKYHFDCINRKLENLLANPVKRNNFRLKFRKLLRERYSLLKICKDHINTSYGLIMLIISMYMVFSAPGGAFFLISVVFETNMQGIMNNYHSALTSILWNASWLTMYTWMLSGNDIDVEANKTAKILSTVPRTGTGIEKMVQKFLLKNLRKKPILTAYGFFSLDKSTLFKLFTAIFTYMVILVQFKEMESSRKQLGQTTISPIE